MLVTRAYKEFYELIEHEPRGCIQALNRPRQTEKTPAARQVAKKMQPVHIEQADAVDPNSKNWILP